MAQNVDRSTPRKSELDVQMDSLEQKEAELHRSQLTIFRQQTVALTRELVVLQREVQELKGLQAMSSNATRAVKELQDVVRRDKEDHDAIRSRIVDLERDLPKCKEDITASKGLLLQQVQELRDLISSERSAREKFQQSFLAKEGSDEELRSGQQQVVQEVQELRQLLDAETAMREELQAYCQARVAAEDMLLSASRGEMQQQLQDLRDTFAAEQRNVREMFQDLHEQLHARGEASAVSANHQLQALREDQAAHRATVEGSLRKQEILGERVAALQQVVGSVEGFLHKDVEERRIEMQRLWSAIENHTHDLDLSALRLDGDGGLDGGSPLSVEDVPGALSVQTVLEPPRVATPAVRQFFPHDGVGGLMHP